MDPSLTRNIGIIAHIDAGKTTFTERALFYSDTITRMGEVHEGSATMDFLPDEQERGITIAAACAHCVWNNHEINIIDTPGHVDFTMEVERSLRVLDGAVGVFCAVSGVEPQSEHVWRQSERYKLPKLAVINKMDKPGADFINVLIELQDKLGTRPLPVTVPIGQGELFSGVIDLVNKHIVEFSSDNLGRIVTRSSWTDEIASLAAPYYDDLMSLITEDDDVLLAQYLSGEEIPPQQIIQAIKQGTVNGKFTPVFATAAFRNIGIQPVLDGICQFLPSPQERYAFLQETGHFSASFPPYPPTVKEPFCGFVFKTSRDKKGKIIFLRVYSGQLKSGDQVFISRTGETLDTRSISQIYASSTEPVELAIAGDIVALAGTTAITGDTLVDRKPFIELEPITAYPPVIAQVFEPLTAEEVPALEEALISIVEEDATLSLHNDGGRLLVSGMGELHLDVVKKRLVHQFNIIPRVGFPEVVTLESPVQSAMGESSFCQQLGALESCGFVTVTISPINTAGKWAESEFPQVVIDKKVKAAKHFIQAVQDAVIASCGAGLHGLPVRRLSVLITQIARSKDSTVELNRTDLPAVYKAAGAAMLMALQKSTTHILEPLMKIEISVPNQHLGAVISLLGACNAKIDNVNDKNGIKYIIAFGAMRTLFSFSTRLRSATQGRGEMSIQFDTFTDMNAFFE